MNDYERIARIIRYLDAHHADQPNLAALARHVGLSQHHFHRLFTSWAGITPKDFLQCLTLVHAKELLQSGKSILNATLETGLSSPSRLHDLCVTLEAASPGEMKSGGEGWMISFGFAVSPFGKCLIGESPRGICHISFLESNREKPALTDLQMQWPQAQLHRNDALASKLADCIFRHSTNKNSRTPLVLLCAVLRFKCASGGHCCRLNVDRQLATANSQPCCTIRLPLAPSGQLLEKTGWPT